MGNNFDALLKTDDRTKIPSSETDKCAKTKSFFTQLCRELCQETESFRADLTISRIKEYIESDTKLSRILYSEMSNTIFSLDEKTRGQFFTNIDNLLQHATRDEGIDIDCLNIVVKLYDHSQLASSQINNVERMLAISIEGIKHKLQEEIKSTEREYITLLGIFAAIVMTFFGGLIFSSSVLQNINSISIYRLLFIVDILALVLINVIYILIKFISLINNKDSNQFKVSNINYVGILFAALIVICWLVSAENLPAVIANMFNKP